MGNPDWHVSMFEKSMLVYCPGHAGVKGNDRADRLAGKATITGGLRLGRSEVARSMETLPAGTKPRTSHQGSPGGERRRKRKRSTIFLERTRERAIVNQTNIGTVSRATLGKFLRDRVECIRAFPST
jgi:hypothetical protein